VAGVLQQKGGMAARVQPLSGSSAYTPLVNRGQVEFGLLNAVDVVNAYEGVDNFKDRKNPELRLVGVLFDIQNGIAVPNDSPAKSIKDLKGCVELADGVEHHAVCPGRNPGHRRLSPPT
jgi:TRAP-type uncharacterized transport system substrate-binding protein